MENVPKPAEKGEAVSLERLLPYLLMNYSFNGNIGLYNGKMGGALFFNHYGRYSEIELYDDFAGELFEELYDEISVNTPITLENGLCGIGWGVEYLVQNRFVEGDTDDILEDIDLKIMERDPLRIRDTSLKNGLGGVLLYALIRLTSFERGEGATTPFDREYLAALQTAVNRAAFQPEDEVDPQWITDYNACLGGNICYGAYARIPDAFWGELPAVTDPAEKLNGYAIGLCGGLTGVAFKQMGL